MTLFQLLKIGCTVKFPSGYVLIGDPENNYIDTAITISGIQSGDGVRELSTEGTRLCLKDENAYAKKMKNDE